MENFPYFHTDYFDYMVVFQIYASQFVMVGNTAGNEAQWLLHFSDDN